MNQQQPIDIIWLTQSGIYHDRVCSGRVNFHFTKTIILIFLHKHVDMVNKSELQINLNTQRDLHTTN